MDAIARRRRPQGFTLVEVMLVVVIIGILTTIAYPGIQRQAGRAQKTEVALVMNKMRQYMLNYYRNNNAFPTSPTGTNTYNPPCGSDQTSCLADPTLGQKFNWVTTQQNWTDFTFPPEGGLRMRYTFTTTPASGATPAKLVLSAIGKMPGVDATYQYSESYTGDSLDPNMPLEFPDL